MSLERKRDWSNVKLPIMGKEYNDVMTMDKIKKVQNWTNTGIKGFEQLHKLYQWIVAVYDPKSPLQHEYRGDMRGKKVAAANEVGFEQKSNGDWKPDVYNTIISSSFKEYEDEDPDEERETMAPKNIMDKIIKMIVGYVLFASGHKWQNLCSYENYYVELLYLINKPLSAEKSKDLMDSLQKKDKMIESLDRISGLIEETWDDLTQEDSDLTPFLERELPIKPENQ